MNNNSEAFNMLVREIANSFPYSYEDAEEYAKYLKDKCLDIYNLVTITREN